MRLIRDGEKEGGKGYGGGGRERLYSYRYTVTTRMIPALIKAGSDESRFNHCFTDCEGQSHKPVCPQNTTFEKRNQAEVPLLTSLTPHRQAKPAHASPAALSNVISFPHPDPSSTEVGQEGDYIPIATLSPPG